MTRVCVLLSLMWALFGATAQAQTAPPKAPSPQSKGGATSTKNSKFEELSRAADQAREENRDEDAVRLYGQALRLRPNWKQGLWYSGILLYRKDQYPAVRDLMRRFVAEEAEAGPGWALLGMCEYQTREYARALDHLQRTRALGLGDQNKMAESVFYYSAVLLTRSEKYDDAIALLFAMVKSGSHTDFLTEPIGLAVLREPLLPSEIPSYRHDLVRLAGQAALAEDAKQPEEAERLFTTMLANYPNEPGVHFLYGVFLLDTRPADGIRELKRELEISPSNLTAKLRLAEHYVKDEQLDQALGLAKEAVQLEPEYAPAYLVLGEALVEKGELEKGISALETARKLRPETVRTHWDLLRAYASAGRAEDAKREKEEIERLHQPEVRP